MAQALAQKTLSDKGIKTECDSAGVCATPGQKANQNAIKALEEYGIYNFNHTAKQCTKKMIDESDLVIAMTENHRILLCQKFGENHKIRTFQQNIGDPFGGDIDTYRVCAEKILSEILDLFEKGIIYG